MNTPALQVLEEKVRQALADIAPRRAGSIEEMVDLSVVGHSEEQGVLLLSAKTTPWMRNIDGVIHGGACATVLDEAMGCVANCLCVSDKIAPTVQMQLNYHRPLLPGQTLLIRIRPVSVTKHLVHISAEACCTEAPEKVCVSASATYYCK